MPGRRNGWISLEANPAACRRLGYTREELLRLKTRDIDAPEFSRGFQDRLSTQLRSGSFRCEAAPAIRELLPGGASSVAEMGERRLGVEQSNTSVQLGDGLLLKLYRRLEAGENPEIEVGAFLESVGCPVVPRIAGSLRYLGSDGSAAAAVRDRL